LTKNSLFNEWLDAVDSYQSGKTFEDIIKEFGYAQQDILRLAGNEATIGTSPKALEAAKNACASSNFYTQPKSEILIEELTKVFEKSIDMQGLAFVAGNGMDSIIEHALTLFTKPGDSIINLNPTFIYYDFAAQRQGLEIINLARNEEQLATNVYKYCVDIDAVITSIKDNTKLIFLCSPNHPDGSVIELEAIKTLAQVCQDRGIVLFVDHAYIEFTQREQYDARSLVHEFTNVIVGYTFSKAYALAGYRVGYALMQKDLQSKFLFLMTPFLIAKPSLYAAIEALRDTEHLEKILNNNLEQRQILQSELLALGFDVFESQANFILFKTTKQDLFTELLKKAIIIRHIKSIDAYRVTVGTNAENQRVLKALKEILSNA
jgi:histidinol-phosphate aminotransferase